MEIRQDRLKGLSTERNKKEKEVNKYLRYLLASEQAVTPRKLIIVNDSQFIKATK
jgi:hypothetical protein